MSRYKLAIIIIIAIFCGFLLARLTTVPSNQQTKIKIYRSKQHQLTNPLLDYELIGPNEPRTTTIKIKVQNYLQTQQQNYSQIAVYFRDLNNGPWFGINERAQFAPVSLLKVPLMIAYLKLAETDPELLEQKIRYQASYLTKANLPITEQLTPDQEYTVDYLLYKMIAQSDNAAFELLLERINNNELKKIHKELDIVYPNQKTPENFINVKSYASLFRILYNSTYLSRPLSEQALTYLLNSDFNLGIRSGLPKSVRSALKYGIKDDYNNQNNEQIHDCGIIYQPKQPYLLCIMTKGPDRQKLVEIIANISKLVYEGL